MSFHRRSLMLALLATPFAGPAFARLLAPQRALVDRATAYLQDLTEAKARFVQTDARGGTTTGTLYIQRPGKARFAYDPPSGLTVVSDGQSVAVSDARLRTFDKYPLRSTPLSLFLGKSVRFDQAVFITRVDRMADGFTIVGRDLKKQTVGQLSLTFTENPLALAGWTVSDAQGRQTRVALSGLTRPRGLDPALFVLKDPRPIKAGRAKM